MGIEYVIMYVYVYINEKQHRLLHTITRARSMGNENENVPSLFFLICIVNTVLIIAEIFLPTLLESLQSTFSFYAPRIGE